MKKMLLVSVFVVGLWGFFIIPTQAQDTWQGNYYANPYFLNEAFLRQDANISFDWGDNAPDPRMPADNFSIRWTKTVTLPAGNYSFIFVADDGVQLGINGIRYLDTFDQNLAGQTVGITIGLPAGTHTINIGYRELGRSAYINLSWGIAPAGAIANVYAPGAEPAASSIPASSPASAVGAPVSHLAVAPVSSSVGISVNPPADTALTPITTATGGTATVRAYRLNVRYQPYVANNRFRIIALGERYNVLGINGDGSWVQIRLGDGAIGWVSARWIALD